MDDHRTIVLLGCVKTKCSSPAPAADLYTSPLWRVRRRYAEASGATWFILSAKHGLVPPSEMLAPYEMALGQRSARERRNWGAEIVADLEAEVGDLRGITVEIHAGSPYRDAVLEPLEERGGALLNPLAELGIGQQLAWYHTQEKFEEAARCLADETAPLPVCDWPGELSGLDQCGLYSWWVDSAGAQHLSTGLEHEVAAGLIYAGQAGATKRPSGRRSEETLASRIGGNHIRGRVRGSTLRLTLAASLLRHLDLEIVGPKKLAPDSEHRLTEWIQDHLAVAVFPHPDRDDLGCLEKAVLGRLDPPLNLDGRRPPSPLRQHLSEQRAEIATGPR